MVRLRPTKLLCLAAAWLACSPAAQTVLAIENVHVIPMVREEILADHVVLVEGDVITAVGPRDDVAIPEGATRIDGRGGYLLPGLADLHVHLTKRAELLLYVAHGVTTVRNMWGGEDTLELRNRIAAGEVLGPTIYTTGPILDGPEPRWPSSVTLHNTANARAAVKQAQKLGYDAVKVYDGLEPHVYQALVARASEAGIPVVGHVPYDVGLDAVLEAGQRSIEHLRGYWPELEGAEAFAAAAAKTAKAGTWNCPTLVVHDLPFTALEDLEAARQLPEVRLVPPSIVARWDPARDVRFEGINQMTPELRAAHQERMVAVREIVGALHDAGAPLVLGTDAPNPFVVPGHAAHEELRQLVHCGLTPFEALQTGTTKAAAFLGRGNAGSIEPGKVADLLLVEGDPLADIGATVLIAGVMARGQWLPRTELDERLEALQASYRPGDWFDGMPELQGTVTRFDVLWNDTDIGAVRLCEDSDKDGAKVLSTQSVLLDGFDTRSLQAERIVVGDQQQMTVRARIGDHAQEVSITKYPDGLDSAWREGDIQKGRTEVHSGGGNLGAGILSHAFALGPRCVDPAVELFEWHLRTPEFDEGFEISRTHMVLRRQATETSAENDLFHRFTMELTTNGFTTAGELVLDRDGMPFSLRLDFPQGSKIIRRAR